MPDIDWSDPATIGPTHASGAQVSAGRDAEVVDPAVLDALTDGDTELADAILADYVESSASDLTAWQAALANRNVDDVRRQAHRIKGASGTVGAHEVSALAGELEAAASTAGDDWDGLRSTARDLEVAMGRVSAAINSAPTTTSGTSASPRRPQVVVRFDGSEAVDYV